MNRRSRQPLAAAATARRNPAGFTLAELLIVIGIIALLVSILLPTVQRIRVIAQETDTKALVRALDAAAVQYESDYGSYPGVFNDNQLGIGSTPQFRGNNIPVQLANGSSAVGSGFLATNQLANVTSSENFFASIMGGFVINPNAGSAVWDPTRIGQGPVHLGLGTGKGNNAYYEANASDHSMHAASEFDVAWGAATAGDQGNGLKHGYFTDAGAAAQDSIIPEFVDRFSDPLPILYLRPTAQAQGVWPAGDFSRPGVYQIQTINGYTLPNGTFTDRNNNTRTRSIGVGREARFSFHRENDIYHGLQAADDNVAENGFNNADLAGGAVTLSGEVVQTSQGPMDGVPFLTDPSNRPSDPAASGRPLGGQKFLLISAGRDRVYGTDDDLFNVGG